MREPCQIMCCRWCVPMVCCKEQVRVAQMQCTFPQMKLSKVPNNNACSHARCQNIIGQSEHSQLETA